MEPAFVSVLEAAQFLGLPRTTVYTLIEKGEFPADVKRLGKRLRINRAQLLALAGVDA
jgi:excisionase family DNA binding protein